MKNYNRLLLILKYLHDNTDEDHTASIKDIFFSHKKYSRSNFFLERSIALV